MKKLIPLLLLFAVCACKTKEIETNIVLKIGSLEITEYEFEKNKNQEAGNKGEKQISDWKKRFIEKCYIVADAYNKKYDTLTFVKENVFYIGKLMMVQRNGYLWNMAVTPIVDKFKEITNEKIEKRGKLFYFDYISCKSLQTLLEAAKGDTVLENFDEYKQLKSKCKSDGELITGYFPGKWPFTEFWNSREYVYNLKQGNVSRLIYSGGYYYYLYLDHVESIKITDQEKMNLSADLQMGIETELDDKKEVEMIEKGKPTPIEENIDLLMQFIEKEKNIFLFKNNPGLMTYTLNGEHKTIDFKSFLGYYGFVPFKPDINDRNTLILLLKQYYYNEYLSSEAEKLGLYKTDQYILDRKNFQNNTMYSQYILGEISNKIKTDSAEVKNFYNKNRYRYTQPQIITADFYYFNSSENALKKSYAISRFIGNGEVDKASDPSEIDGLIKFLPDVKLDLESDAYPEMLIDELVLQEVNTVSYRPLLFDEKYVLMYKKTQEGKRFKKFEKVVNLVQNDLSQQKVEQATKIRLDELRKKYKIELDKTGFN